MTKLTVTERQIGLLIALVVAAIGLAMAAAGRGELFGAQGFIVLFFALTLSGFIIAKWDAPLPDPSQFERYYDDPTKVGIVLTMLWAVIGMFVGVWVAALLAWPDLTFDAAWASFGRLRPVHTSGVIFGFGGNALIATSLPRPAAHVAGAPARPDQPVVRPDRLQSVLRRRRQRLSDGASPSPRNTPSRNGTPTSGWSSSGSSIS